MLLYHQRTDARKLPGEKKNGPETKETGPGGEPSSRPSVPRVIQHIQGQQHRWATSPWSEGYLDYSDALRRATVVEITPKWDSSTWNYQTQLDCPAEETEAIQQYGVEIQKRAYEIACELQDQQDAAEASRAQMEARAERKGAQAKESHAPPSSQTHLMQKSSSENTARSLEHQSEQQRTYSTWTSDRTEQGRFNFGGKMRRKSEFVSGKSWETWMTSNDGTAWW